MAKANNLGDFMTDLADAIREKTGSTEPINPQDFSQKILDIKSGGGIISMPPNDVIFIDYDGTILHSYSKDEFLAIEELPPLPERDGLICQEWNWTLSDAKEYVSTFGIHVIGANYITDDGATRLYLTISNKYLLDVKLCFDTSGELLIEWGDGTTDTTGTGMVAVTHKYAQEGNYCIAIKAAPGVTYRLGQSTTISLLGNNGNDRKNKLNCLNKVEVGTGVVEIIAYNFKSYASLESITIPKELSYIGAYSFSYCGSLKGLVIPNGATTIYGYLCERCYSIYAVSIPKTITKITSYAFYNCSSIPLMTLPIVTTIEMYYFYNCMALRKLIIPEGVTAIKSYAFQYCYSLTELRIPSSVTSIEANAFGSCHSLVYCDFSSHTTIPTIANYNFVSNYPSGFKIIVPDSLYDSWITATNWTFIKSVIIKKSDWDAQNA